MVWYFIDMIFFKTLLPFPSGFKMSLLRFFGSKIGTGVVIKPNVHIKYPWFLTIGDHCWIGEGVWIDNLAQVTIGANVCLSQGSYLLTGSHDYKKNTFDLITRPITVEEGTWIGAKAIVCPGVTCHNHSVLAVGSVAVSNLEAYGIYQGNPAVKKRKRAIE
nr:WcaF family extracellular polysaccharide biosynthesis acetyltransferase [Candidatus Sulfuricurvum sp. RIFRC-1]